MHRAVPRCIPLLAVCAWAVHSQPARAQPPAASSEQFATAVKAAGSLPRLHSLLINRRGALVLERYFHGTRASSLANIKSASKSVISALVGIAIQRGLIPGVDAPIAPYFPELLGPDADAVRRSITIGDLLTMRSGLESTSSRNYGAWVQSSNWVRYALTRPLEDRPGGRMIYSTGDMHLLSAILTKAAKQSTWEFARDTLAEPLGFTLARWPQDPQGIYFGGNDMEMTSRQMMAFGQMYLDRGRANGRQVVPAKWVEASFVVRAQSPRGFGERFYGYGWWIRDMAGHQVYYAWGYGGQFIFIVPDLDLVVVTTSSTASEDRRGHLQAVYRLVEDQIIGTIDSNPADE
jgi:CubicO group peptidase (beta-lactamase class C family)